VTTADGLEDAKLCGIDPAYAVCTSVLAVGSGVCLFVLNGTEALHPPELTQSNGSGRGES
jgi:hypothetical protein